MPYLASAILMYIHYIIIPIFPCIERRFLELKKKTSIDMLKRGQITFLSLMLQYEKCRYLAIVIHYLFYFQLFFLQRRITKMEGNSLPSFPVPESVKKWKIKHKEIETCMARQYGISRSNVNLKYYCLLSVPLFFFFSKVSQPLRITTMYIT